MENREYRIIRNTVRSLTDSTDVKIITRDLMVSICGRNGMRPAVEFEEVSDDNGIGSFLKRFRSFFASNGSREALFIDPFELPHLFMEFGGSEHEDTLPGLKDCLHGNLYGDSETGVLIERVPLTWALNPQTP